MMNLKITEAKELNKFLTAKKHNGYMYELAFNYWKHEGWMSKNIPLYLTIRLDVYRKRKQIANAMENSIITGADPLFTYCFCKEAYNVLEQYALDRFHHKEIHICVGWTDNRRRNAYLKFLGKRGFKLHHAGNINQLIKVIKRG